MLKNFAVLVFAIAAGLCFAQLPESKKVKPDVKLMEFMMNTQAKSQINPARSMDCFGKYIPKLNGIADKYEKDYENCLYIAENDRSRVDETTKPKRSQLESANNLACQKLTRCPNFKDSVSYFNCFVDGATDNSKEMYRIAANATDALSVVHEEYRLIGIRETNCTNIAERAYVENTASTYDALHLCLSNN